jgi:hypothetical protein
MGGDFVLFAAAETFQKEVEKARSGGQIETSGVLIAVSIGIAIGVMLFAAVYIRHRRQQLKEGQRNRISTPKSSKPVASEGDEEGEGGSDSSRRRVRKRRRKRDHRPRNPTLNQTGGLPPLRPDDELPKF